MAFYDCLVNYIDIIFSVCKRGFGYFSFVFDYLIKQVK